MIMVHRILIRKSEGFIVDNDGDPLLLTAKEYKSAKKRFKDKFAVDKLRKNINGKRKK